MRPHPSPRPECAAAPLRVGLENSVRLRDYRPRDFEAVWALDQSCFAPGIAYSRAELRASLSRKTAETIVAESGGGVVAFVLGCLRGRTEGHVVTLDVAPSARRRGLGRRLLTALEGRFCGIGVRRVRLEAAASTAAIAFYERLGYQTARHLPDYYGPGLHAWEMEKELGSPGACDG